MKIIFAGTPDFAVAPLKALYNEHDIVAVFTQPDRKAGRGKKLTPPPVKIAAQAFNIPVFQPHTLKDQVDLIKQFDADVMVVVAYGMLLPQNILDTPKLGCINIHASILPRWRGAAPIQRAIESGDTETGVSIMRMELGLDTGPVYQILKTPILASDTSSSLHDKLAILGAQGIQETLRELSHTPDVTPALQDDRQSNYARKINKDEAVIDWTMSATAIDRRIRAFTPWPICQTHHNGTRIRIWQATDISSTTPNDEKKQAGQIIAVNDDSIDVNCGSGVLRLKTLQKDGSKQLAIREFCNGYPLTVADYFGANQAQH